MAASPLPCSLIEFYRHINNSQAAESKREKQKDRLLMLVFTGGGFGGSIREYVRASGEP